jgi:ubiquinone/menaquinone biosynthesis C-methylase UbiE
MQDHHNHSEAWESKHLNSLPITDAISNSAGSPAYLRELVTPHPNWHVLDVAAGKSETAPLLAQYVHSVVALDVTPPASPETQRHIAPHQVGNIAFCHAQAEHLPFASASFECVTSWLTSHRFLNVAAFVQEAARVLVPGGVLALADFITSGEPRIARYINTLNRLRNPSHVWAFSLDDWETFLFSAGIAVTHSEAIEKETYFDEWAKDITGNELTRLRVLIARAPRDVQAWLRPRTVGNSLIFSLIKGVIVGYKP